MLRELRVFQMAAELVMLVASLLALWNGSKATNLAVNGEVMLDLEAVYLGIQNNEPNDKRETFDGLGIRATYLMAQENELRQRTLSNQCMRNGREKGTYNENFENEKGEEKVTVSYDNNSYMEKGEKSWHYMDGGVYMDVEGMVKDGKGFEEDTVGGKSLAYTNKFYRYINMVVYMVNFVYSKVNEYLTAELYAMVTLIGALMIWRTRSTRRKKTVRRSHLGCYEKKVVLCVPVARLEKRRQRLHELCLQRKVRAVLWLSMMGSAQAMQEGSPVAAGSQGERVFLERGDEPYGGSNSCS